VKLDLNLLTVFDAVLRTGSVTKAAEVLGLNQSSTSNALQRLRETLGDPLFIRSGNRMVPTPLAAAVAQPIRNALNEVGDALQAARAFDPRRSDRTFRIAMNDLGQLRFMPRLMAHAREVAPGITLETVDIDPNQVTQSLAEGGIDLVIGPLKDFGPRYHRRRLISDTLVCVVSAQHPTIRNVLTMDAYLSAVHGAYRPAAASHAFINRAVENVFLAHRRERRVAVRLAYTIGLGPIIESSDLIFTLPGGLAARIAKGARLRVLATPFKAPKFEISQQWHDRYHRDPGNQWLRKAVEKLFLDADPTAPY
jgi:DNA-binding transcriptional LysR family regulator